MTAIPKIFGCKVNRRFAELWAESGALPDGAPLVATCRVTDQARLRWMKHVKKAADALPDGKKLYLTGCSAFHEGRLDPDFWARHPEIVHLRGKVELLPEEPPAIPASAATKLAALRSAFSTRRHVVVQNGCGTNCTFCATVSARGAHRWTPADAVVAEIRSFAEAGGREAVLTGINLGAWGAPDTVSPGKGRLPELVETILRETGIVRLRISSVGAEFVTEGLASLFREPRVNAYAHVSVQSGSGRVLKLMGRRYGRDGLVSALGLLAAVRRPDSLPLALGADLIAGFPGESGDDFLLTLELVRDFGISVAHAFPFSPHAAGGEVPAARLPGQLPEHVRRERAQALCAAGAAERAKFLAACAGKPMELLAERPAPGAAFAGWSRNYVRLSPANFRPDAPGPVARGSLVPGVFTGGAEPASGEGE